MVRVSVTWTAHPAMSLAFGDLHGPLQEKFLLHTNHLLFCDRRTTD